MWEFNDPATCKCPNGGAPLRLQLLQAGDGTDPLGEDTSFSVSVNQQMITGRGLNMDFNLTNSDSLLVPSQVAVR